MGDFYIQTLGFLVERRFAIGNEEFRKGIGGPETRETIAVSIVANDQVVSDRQRLELRASEGIDRLRWCAHDRLPAHIE